MATLIRHILWLESDVNVKYYITSLQLLYNNMSVSLHDLVVKVFLYTYNVGWESWTPDIQAAQDSMDLKKLYVGGYFETPHAR